MVVRRIDLNLLHVFEAILQHRSVAGAGRQLGVTPSAVSHALSRLRQALGDELFVSSESGMEPTARALQLAPDITDGLARLTNAIRATTFSPAEAIRTFRIAATEYGAVTVLPQLVKRMSTIAPQIDLQVFPLNRLDVVRQLDNGRVDLVISWFADLPDRIRRCTLLVETEAIVVRAGHPLAQRPITKELLFEFPYVVVELTGAGDPAIDGFMDDRGVARRVWIERLLLEMSDGLVGRVAVTVPHYSVVPSLLCVTDMVATLPRSYALKVIKDESVIMLELPYEPKPVNLEMIWHQRSDRDPGTRWLITEIGNAMLEPAGD